MRVLDLIVRTQGAKALGWALIHSLWEGVFIAAALGAILLSIRSARVRYMAGCAALVVMLLGFAITLLHFLPLRGGSNGAPESLTLPPWSTQPERNANGESFFDFGELIPWLAPFWVFGACLSYLRCAFGWLWLYRVRRRGVCNAADTWQRRVERLAAELKVSRAVVLLESLLADTPVVLGHLRPAVLVPLGFLAGLPPEHVEVILLHELAHIKRADYLVNVCQRLVEGLLFYHPAMWWISHVIRAERENCCDDMVVALRGDPHGYALALATLEENRLEQQWHARESVVAATGGNLMKRVKRLLYPKSASGIWAPALTVLILLSSTALVLSAWQGSPGQASEQTDKNLKSPWQKWLNEDVVYIITDQERVAFKSLTSDEERQQFVEQFWERHDPTPGTPENEFKEEHYRRITYANKHWGGSEAGWKADRGRIYIRYGPPDEIDSHPAGGSYDRPASEGGGAAMTYPFEDWRYLHFENIGSLDIEFVDLTSTGDFRMTLDPKQKYKKP